MATDVRSVATTQRGRAELPDKENDVDEALQGMAIEAGQTPDEELYRRIGAVTQTLQDDPDAVAKPFDVEQAIASRREQEFDLIGIGRRITERINREARALVCGDGPDWKAERERWEAAVKHGIDVLSKTIAALLAKTFVGLPYAVAAWVAGVIAKMLVRAGHGAICDVWPKATEAA